MPELYLYPVHLCEKLIWHKIRKIYQVNRTLVTWSETGHLNKLFKTSGQCWTETKKLNEISYTSKIYQIHFQYFHSDIEPFLASQRNIPCSLNQVSSMDRRLRENVNKKFIKFSEASSRDSFPRIRYWPVGNHSKTYAAVEGLKTCNRRVSAVLPLLPPENINLSASSQ